MGLLLWKASAGMPPSSSSWPPPSSATSSGNDARRWSQRVQTYKPSGKKHPSNGWAFFLGSYEARTRHRHPAKGLREGPFAGTLPDLDFDCRASAAGGGCEFFPTDKKTGHPNRMSCSIWSGLRGSNSLPPPWQGGALPDELSPRNKEYSSRRTTPCQEKTEDFPKNFCPQPAASAVPSSGKRRVFSGTSVPSPPSKRNSRMPGSSALG